jgi:hypothetical protein
VPKDKHNLVPGDIDPTDKMNYSSVVKLIDPKVEDCLLKFVPGSATLGLYLKMMRSSLLPFTSENMEPLQRLHSIWYAAFFLRIWRKSLQEVKDLFITYNAYSCVELNAHAIINLLLKFLDTPTLFIPTIFNSQVCESFFRRLRSMTSTCSTVVNFTLLDVLYKIKRIDVQENIVSSLSGKFIFPREKKTPDEASNISLPTIEEIEQTVESARLEAILDLKPYIQTIQDNENLACLLEPITHSEETMIADKLEISTVIENEDLLDIITDIHLLLENHAVDDTITLKEYNSGKYVLLSAGFWENLHTLRNCGSAYF